MKKKVKEITTNILCNPVQSGGTSASGEARFLWSKTIEVLMNAYEVAGVQFLAILTRSHSLPPVRVDEFETFREKTCMKSFHVRL